MKKAICSAGLMGETSGTSEKEKIETVISPNTASDKALMLIEISKSEEKKTRIFERILTKKYFRKRKQF